MKVIAILFLTIFLFGATGCASQNNQPTTTQKAVGKSNQELNEADKILNTTDRGLNTVERTGNVLDRLGTLFN